jgi:LacI family transcriptional regulator
MALKEIANILGVSSSTVSLVLHNRPGVSDKTRERVTRLLKVHGYLNANAQPDGQVGGLYLFRYSTVGYDPDKNDSLVTSIIDVVGREARERNLGVSISVCHEGEFLKNLNMLDNNPLSGIILLGTELPLIYEQYFSKRNTPIVMIDSKMPFCPVDSVSLNNEYCTRLALEHLHSLGHRQIGLIHSCLETANTLERKNSFFTGIQNLNLPLDTNYIYSVGPSMNDCILDMQDLLFLRKKSLPTAFLAENDTFAIGCTKVLKQLGYHVPSDISIIGFGNIPFSRMTDPMLTTIDIPSEHMGKCALDLLCERIKNPALPFKQILVSGILLQRDSTAPVSLPIISR